MRQAVESGASIDATADLAQMLVNKGRTDEAERLIRFGIEPGGTTAQPWRPELFWLHC